MPDLILAQHAAKSSSSNPGYPDDGAIQTLLMDPTTGALKVTILGGAGSGGTSSVDKSGFTAGTSAGTPAMGVVNPGDTPSNGTLAIVALDSSRNLKVNVVAGGAGGGAVTSVDGGLVTLGTNADVAVVGDNAGTVNAKLRGINKILNSVWSSANSWLQVSIQNATLAVTQSGTWVIGAGSALIGKVGIDQTTPGTTNGVQVNAALPAGTNVIGHVIADTGSTTVVTGTVAISAASLPLPTGAATLAKQPALGTAGSASADVISVQGIAAMTALKVDGSAVTQPVSGTVTTTPPSNASSNIAQINGHTALEGGVNGSLAVGGTAAAGASLTGNPLRLGGLGRTTTPTTVSSAQLVDLLLDRLGRTFVVSPVTSRASSAGTPITTNTNTSIVAAPSAGNHLRIHRLWAQNSGATATWCYWGGGSGVKDGPAFYLAQGQPFSMAMEGRWELATATALFMNTATTGANIEWYVEYETLAD